jgi:hypothetical protein
MVYFSPLSGMRIF